MHRDYSNKDLHELFEYFKKNVKGISIASDIIVGFPNESEDDLMQTFKFIEKYKPQVLNISKYYDRPNTESNLMENKISNDDKKRRAVILMELHKKHIRENKKDYKNNFALVDEKGFARTSDYFKVKTSKKLGEYYRI
jgi:tRNA A37 methylthiotransferase MiaB